MRRRGIFNPFQRPARQMIDEQLILANSLFDEGKYIDAGLIFERLAQIASTHNGPRAPHFFFQAGRAFLHAGKLERGMDLLESGHSLLIRRGHENLIERVSLRLQIELTQLNLLDQSKLVAGWSNDVQYSIKQNFESSKNNSVLPLRCPSCGGPLHPNEVIWLNEITAECDYCGSPIRAD